MPLGEPVSIQAALSTDDLAEVAAPIGAFLLLAGVWHQRGTPDRLLPEWQLETTGFTSWRRMPEPQRVKQVAPAVLFEYRDADGSLETADPGSKHHEKLVAAIKQCIRSGSQGDAAQAVVLGTQHPGRLIRLAAQISAYDLFRVGPDLGRKLQAQLAVDETISARGAVAIDDGKRDLEDQLQGILQQRIARASRRPLESHVVSEFGPARRARGLILIHGTNLWWHSPPVWSNPGDPLFEYIRKELRHDIYGAQGHFRWEGNYNDRAREVAAHNLTQWIGERSLQGVDAVTHSHGGNVLMKATELGAVFGHVLLLSCPVRRYYRFADASAISARSVRTCFDLVVLADRAAQKFPPRSGISETYLPIWYGHSGTTRPEIWAKHKIRV